MKFHTFVQAFVVAVFMGLISSASALASIEKTGLQGDVENVFAGPAIGHEKSSNTVVFPKTESPIILAETDDAEKKMNIAKKKHKNKKKKNKNKKSKEKKINNEEKMTDKENKPESGHDGGDKEEKPAENHGN
jgi:hypothetical protein